MASGQYVACPSCARRFFVGDEFFTLPDARCHCPYCAHQFAVNAPSAGAEPARPTAYPSNTTSGAGVVAGLSKPSKQK